MIGYVFPNGGPLPRTATAETDMDLDAIKSADNGTNNWARVGMLVCFALAVGILAVSIWMPASAKAAFPPSAISRAA